MHGLFSWLRTSPERLETVISDIEAGSVPQVSFFVLLGTASVIASVGLVANSTAVVIGAMLVSPLMTPIFGISLGMLRGDLKLLGRAATSELFGILLAVALAYVVGLFPVLVEAQPEMVSRTHPTILDLLVAVFAGFAGAFALVDVRVSPALPGVAIATAIVPPLSTSGLYLGLGDFDAALGAFVLFVANFVSILLVGLMTFAGAGIAPTFKWTAPSEVVRRFGLASVGFILIVIFLWGQIGATVERRREINTINAILSEEFSRQQSAVCELVRRKHVERLRDEEGLEDTVRVIATVRSPELISPEVVHSVELKLSDALLARVQLIVQSISQEEVAAVGSTVKIARGVGRGLFEEMKPGSGLDSRIARQVLLERLSREPGFSMQSVECGETAEFPFVLATIQTVRDLLPEDVRVLRNRLRDVMQEPTLELAIRSYHPSMVTSDERFLFEWTDLSRLARMDEALVADVRRIVEEEVERLPDLSCLDLHFHTRQKPWRVLAEALGPRPPTPDEVRAMRASIARRSPQPLEVSIWFKSDAVVTPDGYTSYEKFTEETRKRRVETLPELFKRNKRSGEER